MSDKDTIYRQDVIELVKNSYYNLAESIEDTWAMVQDVEQLPPAQPDEKLRKIADLVEGSIDHFDRDDAMDLLYQIKEIVWNETSNIRG